MPKRTQNRNFSSSKNQAWRKAHKEQLEAVGEKPIGPTKPAEAFAQAVQQQQRQQIVAPSKAAPVHQEAQETERQHAQAVQKGQQAQAVELLQQVIAYWPQVCPKQLAPADYAKQLLSDGPLDQVVSSLIARMPQSVRQVRYNMAGEEGNNNNEKGNKAKQYKSNGAAVRSEEEIPPVEYDPIGGGRVLASKGTLFIGNSK